MSRLLIRKELMSMGQGRKAWIHFASNVSVKHVEFLYPGHGFDGAFSYNL